MKQQLLWLFIVIGTRLFGQPGSEPGFTCYTTSNGLSHNAVTGIAQDSTGYVWISTVSGLNRYNGSSFVQFHSTDDETSPASEVITALRWIDNYRLGAFTSFTGLHIVDTRTSKPRNLFIPYSNKLYQYKFNALQGVLGDNEQNLFLITRAGFYHFDKNYKLAFRYDDLKDQNVATETTSFSRDLLQLDNERFLIISQNAFFIYNKKSKEFRIMNDADLPAFASYLHTSPRLYSFYQQRPGMILAIKPGGDTLVQIDVAANKQKMYVLPFQHSIDEFAYRSRLIRVNDSTLFLTSHNAGFYRITIDPRTENLSFPPAKMFSNIFCNDVMLDRDRQLWVATNRGLFREDKALTNVSVTAIPEALQQQFPNMQLEDINVFGSKIFAATRGHGGLLVFDKSTFAFNRRLSFDGYPAGRSANTIYTLETNSSGGLLLGTQGQFLSMDTSTYRFTKIFMGEKWDPVNDWIKELNKDRDGNLWISANDIMVYNPVSQQLNRYSIDVDPARKLQRPVAVQQDMAGNIWVAGHGICRLNLQTNTFDRMLESFPYIKIPDRQINSMVIDRSNNIWFNSNNNGLICYSIDNNSYRHFTRQDGLPDNDIASLIIIGDRLWIASLAGIACMDLGTKRIESFGKEDGFPDLPVARGGRFFYDHVNQELYVGFATAIARFNPSRMLQKKASPGLFVEMVSTGKGNNFFLPGSSFTSSWQDNELNIKIGTINFSGSETQRFAYRIIKDASTPWQELGSQPSFSISNLSPGRHKIQVRVMSLHNSWESQVREIDIIISPPFWKQGWFAILSITVMTILIYLLIRWRTNIARNKEMEKTHIQKLKADNYQSQFELEQISNYFSSSLSGKKTVDEVLWDVTDNLIGRMNYVDCMIYLWNDDKTKMIQKASYGSKNPASISTQLFDVMPDQGIVGHVMKTKQPILLPDTRNDPRYRIDDKFRLSEICVPILHNGELMGIIDSEHPELNYFKERDVKILTTIATLIGNKIKQIESERTLEVKKEELASINQLLAEAQLSALQAQMNPHFVFNALNSIKRMILEQDNKKASRYLSKFALMIRMTLDHSKNVFSSLHESIEYLKAYLEMERLRFDDSFSYTIRTDESLDMTEIPIPSMMIQPLVENAIWHGLMPVEGEKNIDIAFCQEQNQVICSIDDNGVGIRESERLKMKNRPLHRSLGLGNLHNRIRIMNEKYDLGCTLEIIDLGERDENERGTSVKLRFNIINI